MAEGNTNDIYAAFGLDAPSDNGDDATVTDEAAAPVEPTGDPGPGPDDQKPVEDDASASDNTASEENTEAPAESAEPEETREEPAAAPQPEQKIFPDQDVARDAAYAAAFTGRTNPYTGEPITNYADYQKYLADKKAATEQEKQKEALDKIRELGADEQTLDTLLRNTETGKKMLRAAQFAQQMEQENHRKAINDLIAKDIAEIAKYDPSVKDVESLKKTARGKEIEQRVKSGRYTWKEAWVLENFDSIQTAKTDAARQAAMNAASSKDHLQSTAQRGSGEVDVPDKVAEMYKVMGITDKEEMRKSYASYLKDIKKG